MTVIYEIDCESLGVRQEARRGGAPRQARQEVVRDSKFYLSIVCS